MKHQLINDEYIEVLQQLLVIATPSPHFNGHAPCPWLARGLATGRVVIERGTEPCQDIASAEKENHSRWATAYWYPPKTKQKELELACEIMANSDIECLYMHSENNPPKPMGMDLSGKYPLVIVQNRSLLEHARNNLPPDYPFEF